MKIKFRNFLIFAIAVIMGGCGVINKGSESKSDIKRKNPTVIGDLAHDEENPWGYRIYIEEDGKYVPFIVLTSNYNGNCLLLREFLLDDLYSYNSSGEYGSYYNGSNIDKFLNENYYLEISESTRRLIAESEIEITSKSAIDTHNDKIEIIKRYIFILSANEVNGALGSITLKEGKTLDYFKTIENRIAMFENLSTCSWMLRTPALEGGNTIMGISYNGSIGMGGINTIAGISENAVRPAFCISTDIPIIQSEDIIEGEKVFCIN